MPLRGEKEDYESELCLWFPDLVQCKDEYQIRKRPNDEQHICQCRPKADEAHKMGDSKQPECNADVQSKHALLATVGHNSMDTLHDINIHVSIIPVVAIRCICGSIA